MIFAAKEAVEKRAMRRGRKVGEQAERERIEKILEEEGIELSPQAARRIARESKDRS